MNEKSNIGLWFRWLVFGLALGYWLYSFFLQELTTSNFGWQFRYLTNWALTISLVSAWFMLSRSLGRTNKRFDALASIAVVANALVVFLYWKLYFIDPKLVQGDSHIPWWLQYYIHLAGPVLQWVDALFILGAFQRIKQALVGLIGFMLAYVAWCEFVIGPLNDEPVGKVTTGLPYPFMNDMVLAERAMFYGSTIVTGLVFFAVAAVLSWLIRKFLFRAG